MQSYMYIFPDLENILICCMYVPVLRLPVLQLPELQGHGKQK